MEKKLAHEVVLEKIRKTIDLIKENNSNTVFLVLQLGVLSTECEILEKMFIPENYHAKIAQSLREIKEAGLPDCTLGLFSDALISTFDPPKTEIGDMKKKQPVGYY